MNILVDILSVPRILSLPYNWVLEINLEGWKEEPG